MVRLVAVEELTRHKHDAVAQRFFQPFRRIDAVVHFRPQEHAALWLVERHHIAQLRFQFRCKGLVFLAIGFADHFNLIRQTTGFQILVRHQLRQRAGVQIGGLLEVHHRALQPLRHQHPAHAGARREDFREGGGVHHVILIADIFGMSNQRAERFVGVVDLAVRVVFDNHEVIALR